MWKHKATSQNIWQDPSIQVQDLRYKSKTFRYNIWTIYIRQIHTNLFACLWSHTPATPFVPHQWSLSLHSVAPGKLNFMDMVVSAYQHVSRSCDTKTHNWFVNLLNTCDTKRPLFGRTHLPIYNIRCIYIHIYIYICNIIKRDAVDRYTCDKFIHIFLLACGATYQLHLPHRRSLSTPQFCTCFQSLCTIPPSSFCRLDAISVYCADLTLSHVNRFRPWTKPIMNNY